MPKKISVITPVYNSIRFIELCIENVIAQKCPAVEHVIADGGSTDGTVEVIRRYAEKFPHIRWVSEKQSRIRVFGSNPGSVLCSERTPNCILVAVFWLLAKFCQSN